VQKSSSPRPQYSSLHNNPLYNPTKSRHPALGSNTSATPLTQSKESSRSLSSLHSRDRPRPCPCRSRWRRSCTLVIPTSLVVRPKLSPTVAAATLEVFCAGHREVCESGCCCERHRTVVGRGNCAGPRNRISVPKNATDERTCWIHRSLSHNLLEHMNAAQTFYHSYQVRSQAPRSAQPLRSDSQSCSKTGKHRASADQADVCPEHALQVLRKKIDGLDDGLA